jgi:hypothetical protein
LFGFCVALAAGNVLATVKGALRAVHGIGNQVSAGFFVVTTWTIVLEG